MKRFVAPLVCLLAITVAGKAQAQNLYGFQSKNWGEAGLLFDIDLTSGATTQAFDTLTGLPGNHSIAFNPSDGLIYHAGGDDSWHSDPANEPEGLGYRDTQYMESFNPATGDINPIFNANPAPSPDDYASSGLVAPRPDWVFPEEIRTTDETDSSFQARGDNEYKALRDFAWSTDDNVFIGSDPSTGLYHITKEGSATRLTDTGFKTVSFYDSDGGSVLLGGGKSGFSFGDPGPEDSNNKLYQIDSSTLVVEDDPVELLVPDGSDFDVQFGNLIAMAQNPVDGVLYGVRQHTAWESGARELITIDPVSGNTQYVGDLGRAITSLAFYQESDPYSADALRGVNQLKNPGFEIEGPGGEGDSALWTMNQERAWGTRVNYDSHSGDWSLEVDNTAPSDFGRWKEGKTDDPTEHIGGPIINPADGSEILPENCRACYPFKPGESYHPIDDGQIA